MGPGKKAYLQAAQVQVQRQTHSAFATSSAFAPATTESCQANPGDSAFALWPILAFEVATLVDPSATVGQCLTPWMEGRRSLWHLEVEAYLRLLKPMQGGIDHLLRRFASIQFSLRALKQRAVFLIEKGTGKVLQPMDHELFQFFQHLLAVQLGVVEFHTLEESLKILNLVVKATNRELVRILSHIPAQLVQLTNLSVNVIYQVVYFFLMPPLLFSKLLIILTNCSYKVDGAGNDDKSTNPLLEAQGRVARLFT
jgi:hypothetical protein